MRSVLLSFLSLWLSLGMVASAAAAAAPAQVHTPHMDATLIAQDQGLVPGQTNWVALELKPQKGWHSYWRNPGEAGLPTRVEWTLPKGVTAGAIRWPAPARLETTGFVDYGYDRPTALMVPLQVAANLPTGRPTTLTAHASWLVCKDICIPGDATLALTLPTTARPARANPSTAHAFANARARWPQPLPVSWKAHYQVRDGRFSLGVGGTGLPAGRAAFYAETGHLIDYSATQYSAQDTAGVRLSTVQAKQFQAPGQAVRGVLEITPRHGPARAYTVSATAGVVAAVPATSDPAPPSASHELGLAAALLFALLGGLILNLMPCVFPVLSIKAIGILRAGSLARREQRRQGLAYTAGAVLACVAAAAVMLALRRGGEALGWGFQLQSPIFVALLACLMFALGLSLSGIVSFGTRFMGAGERLTRGGGSRAAFFTGVLAVVVASPCTAPFMGAAMGYAIAQSEARALLVFAALGLGLALPFLVIGCVPRVAGWLPKPGAWMESFKQLMAFPLYLTAVWLVWVLARQSGPDAAALVLVGMVVLGLVLWLRGRWPRARFTSGALALGIAGAVALSVQAARLAPPSAALAANDNVTASLNGPQAWSASRVAQLRAAGRTVFVDFTADWCLTCKVNEHLVLDSSKVRQAFAQAKVAYLRADWTSRGADIGTALNHFGRAGVPLYVVYHGQNPPQVLPQILTPGAVTAAVGG
ncbi:MAG TPA: protein-disulfide reductase DsbD domain-containing protein [Nevskiaceae bacterium]|nr:protein-disulfide reductase DsbD domain-containing protein [Nevskiaceae bacterium]